jgi:hypothetical protein
MYVFSTPSFNCAVYLYNNRKYPVPINNCLFINRKHPVQMNDYLFSKIKYLAIYNIKKISCLNEQQTLQ